MSYRKYPMFGRMGVAGTFGTTDVFKRGKYKGQKCCDVVESDPGYFSWLMDNAADVLHEGDYARLTAILSAAATREGITLQKDYQSLFVWDWEPLLNHYLAKMGGSKRNPWPKKEKAKSDYDGAGASSGSGNPWAATAKWSIPEDLRPYAMEVIAAGRRALALTHHPDRGGDAEQMVAVNRAADLLELGTQGTLSAGGAS